MRVVSIRAMRRGAEFRQRLGTRGEVVQGRKPGRDELARILAGHDAPQPETSTQIIDKLYPNPTSGTIFIKMKLEGRYHIAIYTLTGLMVEERYVDDDLWMVDMGVHADGLYVIRVTDANNQFDVAKFILRR